MSFFANTDLGVTTNRYVQSDCEFNLQILTDICFRVSQDIRLVDSELPISLLDLTAGEKVCLQILRTIQVNMSK